MNVRQRVVHIVQDLRIGGLERVIQTMSTGLDHKRYESLVLCLTSGGEIAEEIQSGGVDVAVLQIRDYHSAANLMAVVRWLKKKRIDIVHTHGYPAGILGRTAAKVAGVRSVFHHFHTAYIGMSFRHRMMERILCSGTRMVLCCSEAVRKHTREWIGLPEKKLIVLYNGVSDPECEGRPGGSRLRESLGIANGSVVIGCVASLVPHKGHLALFEAFRRVKQGILLLVGSGPFRGELEHKAIELGIEDRVIFSGQKSDVGPFLRIMDIAVLTPLEREGLGLSIIEAMARSKPVVATRVGGIPEVVDHARTGFLVAPGNTEELVGALEMLIQDAKMRESMGALGRNRYQQQFSSQAMLHGLDRIYGGRHDHA